MFAKIRKNIYYFVIFEKKLYFCGMKTVLDTIVIILQNHKPMRAKTLKTAVMTFIIASTPIITMAQSISYPPTAKDGTVDEYFGVKVSDPYRWLENDTSLATAEWVKSQNAVTDSYLKSIPQRSKLQVRLKELSDYERVGMPFERHGKWYIYKNDGLQNQSVLYTMDSPTGAQRVFLDPNTLSSDGTVALKGVYFSNDGKYAAYAISRSGSDWQEFYVIDVASGRHLSDHIEWAKFSGASWHGDGFYYSAYDHSADGKEYSNVNEMHKIYYHRIGTSQSEDHLIYMNAAFPQRFYNVSVNKEETIMMMYESGAGLGNNLFLRDLRVPGSQLIQVTSNMDYTYSPIGTLGDTIYLATNDNAPKMKVMAINIKSPEMSKWRTVIDEGKWMLEDANLADGRLLITYTEDASTHAYLFTIQGKPIREIALPGVGTASFSSEKDKKECFYTFTSFTVPGTVYSYDLDGGASTLFNAPKVNFNLNGYTTEQVFFESKDGTRVPMFLTYKKGLKRNGKNPVLLYGY